MNELKRVFTFAPVSRSAFLSGSRGVSDGGLFVNRKGDGERMICGQFRRTLRGSARGTRKNATRNGKEIARECRPATRGWCYQSSRRTGGDRPPRRQRSSNEASWLQARPQTARPGAGEQRAPSWSRGTVQRRFSINGDVREVVKRTQILMPLSRAVTSQ